MKIKYLKNQMNLNIQIHQMEIQDQQDLQAQGAQDLQQEMDQAVAAQEALLDQAVQEAQEVEMSPEDQAQGAIIAQEGIQEVLQMITQEEIIPETIQEETLLATAEAEGVKITLGIIPQIITIIHQVMITLLGMEIAAMVIRQEKASLIREVKEKKAMKIRKLKKVRMKALTRSLKKALKKKAKKK